MTTSKGRGGRRPGAGAPKGNKNRLRHGRYSSNHHLREAMATLTPPQRHALLPYIREGAKSIKRRQSWLRPPQPPPDPKVIPFPVDRTDTTTTHAVQSKRPGGESQAEQGPLRALALRLASHGFMGAEAFIRAHSPAAPVIEHILDDVEAFDDDTYSHLRNPGGFLKNAIHEEIAEYSGPVPYCPYCRWTAAQGKEQTS